MTNVNFFAKVTKHAQKLHSQRIKKVIEYNKLYGWDDGKIYLRNKEVRIKRLIYD